MKMLIYLLLFIVTFGLFASINPMETFKKIEEKSGVGFPETLEAFKTLAFDSKLIAKGGVGVIEKDVHVLLISSKNSIVSRLSGEWHGQSKDVNEVVIVFEGKVFTSTEIQDVDGFDLANCILVSFQRERVRVFNFKKFVGGYYSREGYEETE